MRYQCVFHQTEANLAMIQLQNHQNVKKNQFWQKVPGVKLWVKVTFMRFFNQLCHLIPLALKSIPVLLIFRANSFPVESNLSAHFSFNRGRNPWQFILWLWRFMRNILRNAINYGIFERIAIMLHRVFPWVRCKEFRRWLRYGFIQATDPDVSELSIPEYSDQGLCFF